MVTHKAGSGVEFSMHGVLTDCERVSQGESEGSDREWPENGLRVLKARYLKKDEQGRCVETASDLFRRVAQAVAEPELLYADDPACRSEWEGRFYSLMMSRRFMPNSPTLMNAGREMGMLSACFVLPVGDSINEIFDSIKHTALIQKAGGGTGFAFDELRPTGDYIRSSGGTTSGPISFWRAFSEATSAIQQGAFRRGANMGMMSVDHPDILKFLHAKQDLKKFTNYNISVKVADAWMEALRARPDDPHVVCNPRNGAEFVIPKSVEIWEHDIRSLVPVEAAADRSDYYSMADIWRIIVRHAWQTGEPGVVFIDRINAHNPTPHLGRIEATNPCGEQPLLPYEACNLGSVNLSAFVTDPCTPAADVDWRALGEVVDAGVRFLDNVIDANRYPLDEIDHICKGNRKIGLGVMGFADALYKLGVGYNTESGTAWGERFMRFVNERAHAYSETLAARRGNFPNWKGSIWDTQHHRPMRNACCTTIAPTGTISIIAGCSCGIEPLFGLVFYRNVLQGQEQSRPTMIEVNPVFRHAAGDLQLDKGVLERIAREGTLAHLAQVPEAMKRVFVCANDVSPEGHVHMQAAFQKHCDASISKTINFPHGASADQVRRIYEMCYDQGCKGVTIYRDGCRANQPMARHDERGRSVAAENTSVVQQEKNVVAETPREPRPLPELVSGVRVRQMTPFGNMHVHITVDPKAGNELEVFAQLGRGGDLANSDLEAICRLVSLWLRSGGALHHIIGQLKGIGSSLQVSTRDGKIMSLGDGLARALTRYAQAKARFGTKALLLGEFDLSRVEQPLSPGPERPNGNGRGKGNGHGSRLVRHGGADGPPASSPDAGSPASEAERFKVICPDCHTHLRFSEGCVTCESCGFAMC